MPSSVVILEGDKEFILLLENDPTVESFVITSGGPAGQAGPAGSDGRTIWHGTTVPASALGADDDFYIRTDTSEIYGPKTAGAWGTPTSLVGAQGLPGTDGADGRTIWNGSGSPSNSLGLDGDIYLDTTNNLLFGPKSGGAWGTGTSLIGPRGYSVLNGAGAPGAGVGGDGDFYIDTTNAVFYGPKTAGAWGAGNNILLGQGAKRITVGPTPPTSPAPGDLWVDTT